MSGWGALPNWIIRSSDINPNAKIVLLVIASHVTRTGYLLYRRTIAEESGLSLSTVQRAIAELQQAELLVVEPTLHANGQGANRYQVTFTTTEDPRVSVTTPPVLTDSGSVLTDSGSVLTDSGSVLSEPLNEEEPKKKNKPPPLPLALAGSAEVSLVNQTGAADEAFATFWAAYPRKVAKQEAHRAWPAALKAAGGLELIMNGVRLMRRPDDPTKIPHPATWLRGERWNDETPTPTVKERRNPL